MASLYKYTQRHYVQAMLDVGTYRIGTLEEYRNEERFGSEIGDAEEGRKTTYSDDQLIDWGKPDTVPDFAKRFVKVTPGRNPILRNVVLNRNEASPNCYIYFVSKRLDSVLMRQFSCDAVVEIVNLPPFFEALSATLCDAGKTNGKCLIAECVYGQRSRHYSQEDSVHPALLKDVRFKHQEEVRAIWSASTDSLQGIVLQCPEARRFCRMVSDKELM